MCWVGSMWLQWKVAVQKIRKCSISAETQLSSTAVCIKRSSSECAFTFSNSFLTNEDSELWTLDNPICRTTLNLLKCCLNRHRLNFCSEDARYPLVHANLERWSPMGSFPHVQGVPPHELLRHDGGRCREDHLPLICRWKCQGRSHLFFCFPQTIISHG